MLRSTAHVLVIVMLFASGRLLACGLECLDEVAVPAQAPCHQESAPATAIGSDETHACLPEIVDPRVTVAKLATDQLLVAAPLVATLVAQDLMANGRSDGRSTLRLRFDSPHLPGFSVLRI
jgi:hypothetical protein